MIELLRLILSNALAAGVLALAAWAVSRRVRRPTLVHGLWVLALIKLVTPPIVPLPLLPDWTIPSLSLPDDRAMVVTEAGTSATPLTSAPTDVELLLASESATLPALGADTALPVPPPEVSFVVTPQPLAPQVAAESGAAWGIRDVAPLAWAGLLAGALGVAALAWVRIRRFRRLLRLAVPAPAALSARASELADRVGLRRAPPVLLLPARVPPMLWPGRGGPLLLMPAELLPELTDEERDTLLIHELAHVRRRDHWVRLLELTVTVVFWWYPVTWWVRRALRRAEERCCDEWVLRLMPASANAYAEGLLKSLDFVAGEPDPLPVGASGAGPVHDLEARLKEILMMTRPNPQLRAPARFSLAVVALLGLAVFPTQAQSPPPAEPSAPEEAEPVPPAPRAAPKLADAPSPQTPPDAPSPALAPALPAVPAPAVATPPVEPPVVAPAPRVALSSVPTPSPQPNPRPVLAQAPSPENEDALLKIEEQHRSLSVERAELHRKELELTQERMARRSRADQEQMRAEAERLRAAGEDERARLVEMHAETVAQRAEMRRRELKQEQARMVSQSGRESELQLVSEKLRTLEREGRRAEAHAVRMELAHLQHEHAREQLEVENQRLALQREAMEIDHPAQVAEMELARAMAERGHEAMETDIERAIERQAFERALRERELTAREAEQSLRARELAIVERDAAGEHAEAETLRAEAEDMRREVDSLHRGIQEEHLLRATSDLEMQMQSQLEALRHIEAEGATDSAEVQKKIKRLGAALDAMRAAGQ